MNIILLSGGSGTRLWPLSNEVRSKQFLKIFNTETGKESMVQRMYRMIKEIDKNANITIATSQSQIPQIKYQLGENVDISVEPCRRDTFPAIALSCAYLYKKGISLDESVVVCPVDAYVKTEYFNTLKKLSDMAGNANLTLMGIKPTGPSTKFGYILPNGKFIEKPNVETAIELIENGAVWNGGIFAFKLNYLKTIAEEILGTFDYDKIYEMYDSIEKTSFDYAVAEKEKSIAVIPYEGEWNDLGTWNILTQVMKENISGNAKAIECINTHIINELNIPLIALGVDNMVIAATPDGILVTDKEKSVGIKEYVAKARPMHEARPWGHYTVLDSTLHEDGQNSLTKHLILSPNKHISYQKHNHRTEMWTFIEGNGELIIDGVVKKVTRGDNIVIPAGTKHGIKALDNELHIIEVQVGDWLVEEDIERLEWDWKDN